jgi:hypothetical protein
VETVTIGRKRLRFDRLSVTQIPKIGRNKRHSPATGSIRQPQGNGTSKMATSNRIGSERRLERLEAAILTRRGDPQQIFSLHDCAPGALQVIEAVLGYVSGSRSGVVGVYQRHS